MKFSAVILAGGRSERMGQDKAWLIADGKPLIARQVELARELGAAEVFISGRAGTDYDSLGCRVVHDRHTNVGPLAGIESALTVSSTALLLVLAVDMPHMTASPLQTLLVCCSGICGAVPRFQNQIEPLAAIYPCSALPIARELLEAGHYAVRDFAARCIEFNLATFIDLPEQHSACFANWNTPSDIGHSVQDDRSSRDSAF
jgi:molybdopterin-guanine dinucleotide biosynthesis protein A